MIPYLVWSYDYSHASAGPKALHRLCHELNEAGQQAYVAWPTTNPDWRTPYLPAPLDWGDWIAVYPEIVAGNPWNAPLVARWVLNTPGKLGGDEVYDPAEMVFSWSTAFLDAPLLWLPAFETDIYFDRGQPRDGELYYVGKGLPGDTAGQPVTLAMREDRYALADALNHATLLRSFDPVSGMNDIALLCGCPVMIGSERLEPAGYLETYRAKQAEFPDQLSRFIEITQGALVPA